ncbi:hypothetical protein FRB94_010892 [Tulasnella sp. JGI-2019a]|nr:hypothetical protein FRB93_009719 [Tulasnella sp. JGI-2019a]KAG9010193.1 hypothetical protein FRB94_010892 [Tulasnella sp. JGI-2019a]KAG9035619.1 hypothetical protein FRB95_011025 [Tulasnella sp. JGI-2019a]
MEPLMPPNHPAPSITPTSDVEWRYEMRRECQEIAPGLLLGPFQVSKDLEKLKELSVTHILCIRDAKEAFSVKPRFPGQFEYLVLDVVDSEEQNLIRLFPQAKEFINNAIAKGGQVLVHCNGGISLSPSFVIMFVMEQYNMSWEDALHLVQNRRYCISPNSGFVTQIKEYEPIYKASREVTKHGGQNRTVSMARRKRDDDDSEDELEVESRRRVAPLPRTLNRQAAEAAKPSGDVEMS